jgi:hypothetical protein
LGPDSAPKSESSTQPCGCAATTVTEGEAPNGPKEISSVAGDAVVELLVLVEVELVEALSDAVHADPTIIKNAATRTHRDLEPCFVIPLLLSVPRRRRLLAGSLDSQG